RPSHPARQRAFPPARSRTDRNIARRGCASPGCRGGAMEQADPRARDPDELNGGQARALMKTIGLIGGVTWESAAEYYKIINGEVARTLGGAHSARLVLVSLNFEDLLSRSAAGDDRGHRALYCDAARRLER